MKPQQLSNLKARAAGLLPTLAPLAVALASTGLLTLGGCASPAGIAPTAQPLAPAAAGLDDSASTPAVAADWWRAWGDARLDALVGQALAGSPGLAVAQARLARAGAALAGQQSADSPQVNGTLGATRERFSATSIYPAPLGGSTRTLADAQLGASWELDLFGRNRAAVEAAVGSERAAQAELAAARVLLASQVVRGYVQLGRLQAQRDVAVRALAQRDEQLALVRQRVQAGLDTNVELRQGEGALPETRQQIEALDEQIALARNALAALTAQPPAALATLQARLDTAAAPALPAALPADLLARRADVTAARWRVQAAGADLQSARAAFYPNVNLTAFAGLSSIGLNRLLKTDSETYGVGPALHLPIFDAGRLRANLRGKAADVDAAVAAYNGAVLDAVHDAADQIATLQAIARQQAEQAQAQAAAESAYALALQRYRAGLSTYLTVLNAESSVLAQRRGAVDLRARALDTQAQLARALGGGFVAEPAPSTTASR